MMKSKFFWLGLIVCVSLVAGSLALSPFAERTASTPVPSKITAMDGTASSAVGTVTGEPSFTRQMDGKMSFEPIDMDPVSGFRPAPRSLSMSRNPITEADKIRAAAERVPDRTPVHSLDQGGDNCSDAVDLGNTVPQSATGTTAGFADDYDSTGFAATDPTTLCWQGGGPFVNSFLSPDVTYKFTAPTSDNYTFSLCDSSATGNAYDTGLSLWNYTCPTEPVYPTDWICGADDNGLCVANLGTELLNIPLLANQEILIVVDGWGGESGAYVLDIVYGVPCVPVPTNDDCADAVCQTMPGGGGTLNYTGDATCATANECGILSSGASWDCFTTNECFDIELSWCGSLGDGGTFWIVIDDACPCDDATLIFADVSSFDTCAVPADSSDPTAYYYNLPAGTYYVPTHPAQGAYTLTVTAIPCVSCDLVCPVGGIAEGEACPEFPDTTNAGCAGDSAFIGVPQNVCPTIGDSVVYCGTATTQGDTLRDVDYIVCVSITDTIEFMFCIVAEYPIIGQIVQLGDTGCTDLVVWAGATALQCDTLWITVCLLPGEYYLITAPLNFNNPPEGQCMDWVAWYSCGVECIPPDCWAGSFDVTCADTTTFSGNTLGAGDDCFVSPSGQQTDPAASEDEIWEINVLEAGPYTFSLCNSAPQWDSFIFLTTGCCSGSVLNDDVLSDDGCGDVGGFSEIFCMDLAVGTYYLMVEGWQDSDAGAYTVDIFCCPVCNVTCPPNAILENEPVCDTAYVDNFNGGCNSDPAVFSTIACDDTICGAGGIFVVDDTTSGRDMDWYKITLTDTTRLTWNAVAEFNVNIWIIADPQDTCGTATVGFVSDLACSTATTSACLEPGTYYLVLAPDWGGSADCGDEYYAWLECEPCVILPTITTCPVENTLHGAETFLFDDSWGAYLSDSSSLADAKVWEKYPAVGDSICDFHFWGLNLTWVGSWINCDPLEDPETFLISFHPDNGGTPGFPPTCEYRVTLNSSPGGGPFNGNPGHYYETILEPCCFQDGGWVSVQGVSGNGPNPDCLFLWMGSRVIDDGFALQHFGGDTTATDDDISLCLTGAPAPCEAADSLTVIREAASDNRILRWVAPHAEDWLVYASTDPDNTGDPATDASFVLVGTVNGGPGALTYTDTNALVPYLNYVVIPSCHLP